MVYLVLLGIAQEEENILTNGDFEEGDYKPTGWKIEGNPDEITLTNEKAFKSEKSVKLNRTTSNVLIIKQGLPVSNLQGKDVKIKAAVMLTEKGKGSIYFRIREMKGGKFTRDTVRIWMSFNTEKLQIEKLEVKFLEGGKQIVKSLGVPKIVQDYTEKWIEVESGIGKVDPEVESPEFILMADGEIKNIFIDNLSLNIIKPPLLSLTKVRKTYTLEEPLEFEVDFGIPDEELKEYKLKVELLRIEEVQKTLLSREEEYYKLTSNHMQIKYTPKSKIPGKLMVKLILVKKDKEVSSTSFEITRTEDLFNK